MNIWNLNDDAHEYIMQAREEVCENCRYHDPDTICPKLETRRWIGAICTEFTPQ